MMTIAERFAYFKRLVAQAIITPILILLILVGLLSWQVAQLVLAVRWVDHTDQVIAQANLAYQNALRAETGLRGYLISGDARDLHPYRSAQKTISPAFARLRNMVSDNPSQVHQAQQMDTEYGLWVSAANLEIAARGKGLASVQEAFTQARALFPMDTLRAEYLRFISEEDRLRRLRSAKVARTTRGVIASALFLTIAAGLILGLLSVRSLGVVSKEYEHALSDEQESGQMLVTTLLSIGDAVLVTDENGRITHMNSVAEKLTGWASSDAIGKDAKEVFRIINETTRQPVQSPIDRVIREGVVVGLANHTALVRPNGAEVPIDDSGAPIRSEDGKLIGVVLVFRDITERKRAEETRHHLAAIVESSDDAIISKDLNGVITSWNKGAERLFGYRAEEAIGQTVLILYPPDRADEMGRILDRIKAGERVEHYQTVRKAKNGELIDISLTVSPVRDAAGQIMGASKIARDIREQKRAEEQLTQALGLAQKNGEMLATTLLSIGDGVIVTDEQSRVTQINRVAEQISGWKAEDAVGKNAYEVFHIVNEQTREPVESPVERVIREGIVVGLANHTVLIRSDGAEVPIDDSGAPIRDANGTLIGVVLVFRDITERRQAERALAEAFEREHRIAETLQESLLIKPSPEMFPRLETETYYRPAKQEAKVGGDYYDQFPLGEGKVALVVGDISGKGLAAAAKTSELKYTLRSYLREHPDPATGLARLNTFICESHALEGVAQAYFLALTVAVIDPVRLQARIAAGGVEPPIILRAPGKVETPQVSGLPLGIDAKALYDAITVNLEPEDILMIATDGITETRNGRDFFLGIDGLARLAEECADREPLAAMGDCMLDKVQQFARNDFSDDVCLLLARMK